MNGQIFISYRREDAPHPAIRLHELLSTRFPKNRIFIDIDNIPLGVDFVEEIKKNVGACDVLIAIIGKQWLTISNNHGRRRLDDTTDFVRLEIATALKRNIRVIPVLMDGASMPGPDQLPEDLQPLAYRNALSISYNRFRAEAERLIPVVEEVLESARVEQQRKRERQERDAAEQRQREEKERLEAEQRAQAQAERLERERQQQERWRILRDTQSKEFIRRVLPESPTATADYSKWDQYIRVEDPPRAYPSGAEWLAEAKRHLSARDYAKALPPLQKAAEAGNATAMTNLGALYEEGQGVTQDFDKAHEWYEKAAAAGNAEAMYRLSRMYRSGATLVDPEISWVDWLNGGEHVRLALYWHEKAIEAGNTEAMYDMGGMYESGLYMGKDGTKAREWYQKAADRGHVSAMLKLGGLHAKGELSAPQDYARARQWYQKAADAGDADAKQALLRLPSK